MPAYSAIVRRQPLGKDLTFELDRFGIDGNYLRIQLDPWNQNPIWRQAWIRCRLNAICIWKRRGKWLCRLLDRNDGGVRFMSFFGINRQEAAFDLVISSQVQGTR